MSLSETSFEKMGAFYLGRGYDLETKTGSDEPLLYDSRDLTTHAVCVGMTGSGKTGLCIGMLEEAAMDKIPAIIIDPKGDLANLLLSFPNLAPADFRPWINEDDAERKEQSADDYAAAQAQLWRDGLAKWGQTPERIVRLRQTVDMTIYTPGSTSGIAINIFDAFEPPEKKDDPEILAEYAQNATASLLALLKSSADPAQSREGILISTIFSTAWQAGENLSLEELAQRIQRPPFPKIGMLDIEAFFPEKDRFALVLQLNNILASPAYTTWRQGAPLDIAKMLHSSAGKPCLAIFSIAHLNDEQRMFFVSLLLNKILAWTRSQSGTSSLRALVYMDEIYGYLPPTANPPSKKPLMTLLKQARAFGVGVTLATQNPVDLDYKALANMGTWLIGRLQTDRDKARLLDGLQSAASSNFNRSQIENILSGLGKRVFLMHNVNSDTPTIFETRWTMSYLRGPLTRDQIATLMESKKNVASATAPATLPADTQSAAAGRPTLPPSLREVFLPGPAQAYRPALLALAQVTYHDSKLPYSSTAPLALLADFPSDLGTPDFSAAEKSEVSIDSLASQPATGAGFAELPSTALKPANYAAWLKAFTTWVAANASIEVPTCSQLKQTAKPGEALADFQSRINHLWRESRDAATDTIRQKYAAKLATLQTRLERAQTTAAKAGTKATADKINTVISIGSAILGAFMGSRRGSLFSVGNIGRAASATRGINRAMTSGSSVAGAEQSATEVQAQIEEINTAIESEIAALQAQEPTLDAANIKPLRGGILSPQVLLAWIPVG